jgi:8-oxo-dGTP pyrophosphatase MutT (NUDIX family)
MNHDDRSAPIRRGVVAVIRRDERLLVIRRALTVAAGGAYCFPGGGIERDETEPRALIRELEEELGLAVLPGRRLWESTTPWGVHLAWWTAAIAPDAAPCPNPAEVASCHWHSPAEMAALAGLLESNRQFLAALARGDFALD